VKANRCLGKNCHPRLAQFPNLLRGCPGTSRGDESLDLRSRKKGLMMLGKLAGAWLGSRIVGRNGGAKGALLGVGVAALARRGLGPLAAAAAVGYGAKKFWERRNRSRPSYPSEASPAPPEG
jgi:hypothetical protein